MDNVIRRVLRRCLSAVRSIGPATVAVILALIVGGAGLADAATGGTFILGKANGENATATLSDTKGTPLLLQAPAGKPAFAINRNIQIKNLNAEYVGGKTAAELQELQTNAGAGITLTNENIALSADNQEVASTGPLPAGTYVVSATALVDSIGDAAFCYVSQAADADNSDTALSWGGGTSTGYVQAAETVVVTVTAKTTVSEWCYGTVTGQTWFNAGITAIRVGSVSWGTEPIKFGLPQSGAKSQRP